MDATDNNGSLQRRLGEASKYGGMAGWSVAAPGSGQRGGGKRPVPLPPPGNVSLYSCRRCCRRDERWNAAPGVGEKKKGPMIIGAQPLWW